MDNPPMTRRQKNVRLHGLATIVAFVAFLAVGIGELEIADLSLPVGVIAVLTMFIAILVMFFTRNADEYTAAIWRAGTSFAFVITAAIMLFTPFVEGVYDGFTQAHSGTPAQQDLQLNGLAVVVAAFFLGNAWARLRGTA